MAAHIAYHTFKQIHTDSLCSLLGQIFLLIQAAAHGIDQLLYRTVCPPV